MTTIRTPMTAASRGRSACKVISFREAQRRARRERLYFLFALLPQYMALGTLILYGALRLVLTPHIPFSYYVGPLSMLWPAAYVLLLISYVSDKLLWDE